MEIEKTDIQIAIDAEIEAGVEKYGEGFRISAVKLLALLRLENPTSSIKHSRRIPLAQWNKYHPSPSVGTLRQYRFANTDNFNECIKFGGKEGKTIEIDEDKYFEWDKKRQEKFGSCN